MRRITGQREVRPVWINAQRVNHQNKLTHPHPKRNFVPTAVLTKSGNIPVNTAKQISPRASVSNSTARYVNIDASRSTVNEKVNTAKVNNVTTAGTKAVVSVVQGHEANVVKSLACWIWRPIGNVIYHISKDSGSYMLKRFDYGNPQYSLQDQGIFNSGCSRHMTGNKFYLLDYQDIDGGFVAFGGSSKRGKIIGKGKIRTDKLDFEDVYFVKELKFNLFSVSQMCDKKNSVLFTETKCLVLSPDFKLLDESQVLLKIPRQNNMYNFDIKNVVPLGGLTCLFAKATIDESNLWHRRLGHINFKTMNKLVRGNLVRGLPSKLFENDHSCVACQKGKQHKVSWSGPEWLFDIDSLTKSMNYEPVTAENQTNGDVGIETNVNAGQAGQEKAYDHEYILLPLRLSNSPLSSSTQSTDDKDADEVPDKGYDDVIKKVAVRSGMDSKVAELNFSSVTDFAVIENIDAYHDEEMGDVMVGKTFCREICIKARRFDGMITIYYGNDIVTYQMSRSHLRFKHLTNAQCNKMRPLLKCMTRSSTKELFMPFKELEREFRSSRKLFKTLSLDESRSPEFNLFFDLEEYSKEEVARTMAETMEQYMSKTRADYGLGIARPKIDDKDSFELKGQFLKELRDNTFSGWVHEDMNEHIEKVLEIVDLFHIPNITQDHVMLRDFHISLTGAVIRWLRNKPSGLITTWEDLKTKFLSKYCSPARTAKKMEEINNFQQEPDETLYQAWERFKELLMKCPQQYLTEMQEVILFYNGLDVQTRQILDLNGAIPSKTVSDAKVAT
ncbi:ribonuclease H-like domain-containing protein [Tanacetum coccineum]|uniref:Ribonuclease H-like domain-containing protein n=1 Tax=Tanacetum coccineum TaxID=301880 RepID=A0ABQ5I521_9ASTR